MGGSPRGHHDRVHAGVGDELLAGGVHARLVPGGQAVRHGLRPGLIDVGDRDDTAAGQDRRQPADMVLADHADTDDTDVEGHRLSSWDSSASS